MGFMDISMGFGGVFVAASCVIGLEVHGFRREELEDFFRF